VKTKPPIRALAVPLAAGAIVAGTCGVAHADPDNSSDVKFINMLNDSFKDVPGYIPTQQGDLNAIAMGHDVCSYRASLHPPRGVDADMKAIHWMQTQTSHPLPDKVAAAIDNAAVQSYCPQFAD
jgi:hypothetical protein